MYRDIPKELRDLIEPVALDAGFELVDVMLQRGRPPWLLRITYNESINWLRKHKHHKSQGLNIPSARTRSRLW